VSWVAKDRPYALQAAADSLHLRHPTVKGAERILAGVGVGAIGALDAADAFAGPPIPAAGAAGLRRRDGQMEGLFSYRAPAYGPRRRLTARPIRAPRSLGGGGERWLRAPHRPHEASGCCLPRSGLLTSGSELDGHGAQRPSNR